MDNEPFDDLAKALARGVPRRQALRLLGGGLLGFLGYGVGLPGSAGSHAEQNALAGTTGAEVICRHKGHQKVCNGACCAEHGTCETKGHGRGIACEHGGCCSKGETCCASLDRHGRSSETCCKANETCETVTGPEGTYTGTCRRIAPLT